MYPNESLDDLRRRLEQMKILDSGYLDLKRRIEMWENLPFKLGESVRLTRSVSHTEFDEGYKSFSVNFAIGSQGVVVGRGIQTRNLDFRWVEFQLNEYMSIEVQISIGDLRED